MAQESFKATQRPINHIGLSVPSLSDAISWYISILGFRQIRPAITICRSTDPNSPLFDIFPSSLQTVKQGFLSSSNGCCLELWEFVSPRICEPATFDWSRGGAFHFAITDPDPESLRDRVVKSGGKAIGKTVRAFAGEGETDCALYVQDPWGTVIEIMSCSMEQLMANRR